ncbi:DEAD/DEAH box helicase [Catellatospora paridis]|uniref:DEAD/DEAH box helicase n=1 Tax=Catellatospora paridis TaxID=1617086 RepID=UPI0012D46B9F|nr:DEAD/DEAH box helicase [Catellatospora paridis]
MTASPAISLDFDPAANVVLAQKVGAVPDVFWGQLRVEWGYDGDPARAVRVPLERFRENIGWLGPACNRYNVGIAWEPAAEAIITTIKLERRQLEHARHRSTAPITAEDVRRRLEGSRFARPLKPFQLRDAAKLLGLAHGANFSVPGAGKTSVAYAVYEAEHHAEKIDQLLVVAPLSAFDAWQTEVEECFKPGMEPIVKVFGTPGSKAAEILLVNYHRLAMNQKDLTNWVRKRRTLVLLDEAHRMKAGRVGQHGSACLDLAFSASRRDILTGTPAPQSASDFVALYEFLWPGQARRILPSEALSASPPPDALQAINRSIQPLFVRTTKKELELPPPTLRRVVVPLSGLQREIYSGLRDRYAGMLRVSMNDRVELARMGTIVMYLLEAASNPQLLAVGSRDLPGEFAHPPLPVEPGSRLWEMIVGYGRYETPPKFIRLREIIAQNVADPAGPRKTLVWSNFVSNLEGLRRWLADYEPAMIHGGVPSVTSAPNATVTRESELQRFRRDDKCKVLLANPAAMSEGVSLHHDCHDAVYFDRTFNAGHYLQSIDRIHRLGMNPDQRTTLLFMITNDTIDQVVDSRIRDKATNLGRALDDKELARMSLPDDEDYGPPIETDVDMAALLAHINGQEQ